MRGSRHPREYNILLSLTEREQWFRDIVPAERPYREADMNRAGGCLWCDLRKVGRR